MKNDTKTNTNWRKILTIITILAIVIFIIFARNQIISTIKNLHKVDIWALALLIPIEFGNYYAQAKLYKHTLDTFGHELDTKFLFKFSLELNFISTLFPSGGLSGISYTNLRLKSEGVSTAKATLVQVLKTVIVFWSFLILMVFGLIFLALGNHTNSILILVSASIVTTLVILTMLGVYVVGDDKRINEFTAYITKAINNLIHVFRPKVKETIKLDKVRETFTELHLSFMEIKGNLRVLKWPLIWATVANVTEVAALYAVYLAFGHWENPGGIIIAYAAANFSSVLSILPGGVGVYETVMALILAASGIAASLSVPVIIMYRIVNTLIQIVPGYFLYQKALIPKKVENAE